MSLNNKARMGGDDSIELEDADTIGKWYDAINGLNPGVDGVALADYFKMWDIGKALMSQVMGPKKWLKKLVLIES